MKSLLVVLLSTFATNVVAQRGLPLLTPPSVSSVNGSLETVITLELGEYSVDGVRVTAPLFNGTLPGTTLRIRAGDVLNVTFVNQLPPQTGRPYVHNEFSAPTESNLHFHGLFVSGELPSDDASLVVGPGETYEYQISVPASHMPGTHWLHPHRHGSTSLQVGGGAASAVIVEDPPGYLPEGVAQAPEFLLLLQELVPRESVEVIAESKAEDLLYTANGQEIRNKVYLTNGQVQPTVSLVAGQWTRLRLIHAGWDGDGMALTLDGCEMALLAKDGIYIRDFPRSLSTIYLFTGGRADVMVRCPDPATTYALVSEEERQTFTILSLQTSSEPSPLVDLEAFTPDYPDYLLDLRATPATAGCSCTTLLDDRKINGRSYESDHLLHTATLGAVVERTLRADRHPYHQHTYPYQLVAQVVPGNDATTTYYKEGDWHDTYDGNAIIRYHPREFATKVMLHCHKLTHEDVGMMAMDMVVANTSSEAANPICTCDGTAGNLESSSAGSLESSSAGNLESSSAGNLLNTPNSSAGSFLNTPSAIIALVRDFLFG